MQATGTRPPATLTPEMKRTLFDATEKVILLLFFFAFLVPVVHSIVATGNLSAILVLISEGLVVGFTLFRKPASTLSLRPLDWFLAFGATITPLLVRPDHYGPQWLQGAATSLMLVGLFGQFYAKFTLGRSFGIVAANRGLILGGPYRVVRHPIYFFYFVTHVGFLCGSFTLWNLAAYAIFYSLLIPRILAEERVLSEDSRYVDYKRQVRSRLIPGVF